MTSKKTSGEAGKTHHLKHKAAKTADGAKPEGNKQAGSGGRGGHRKRKGGRPDA